MTAIRDFNNITVRLQFPEISTYTSAGITPPAGANGNDILFFLRAGIGSGPDLSNNSVRTLFRDDFTVWSIDATQTLGDADIYEIIARTDNINLYEEGLLDTSVVITVPYETLDASNNITVQERHFAGVISDFAPVENNTDEDPDFRWYRLTVQSRFSRLRGSRDSRVFTGKTVLSIATDIFNQHSLSGIPATINHSNILTAFYRLDTTTNITNTYPIVVQYEEDDLSFVQRIFTREGLFAYSDVSTQDTLLQAVDGTTQNVTFYYDTLRVTDLTGRALDPQNATQTVSRVLGYTPQVRTDRIFRNTEHMSAPITNARSTVASVSLMRPRQTNGSRLGDTFIQEEIIDSAVANRQLHFSRTNGRHFLRRESFFTDLNTTIDTTNNAITIRNDVVDNLVAGYNSISAPVLSYNSIDPELQLNTTFLFTENLSAAATTALGTDHNYVITTIRFVANNSGVTSARLPTSISTRLTVRSDLVFSVEARTIRFHDGTQVLDVPFGLEMPTNPAIPETIYGVICSPRYNYDNRALSDSQGRTIFEFRANTNDDAIFAVITATTTTGNTTIHSCTEVRFDAAQRQYIETTPANNFQATPAQLTTATFGLASTLSHVDAATGFDVSFYDYALTVDTRDRSQAGEPMVESNRYLVKFNFNRNSFIVPADVIQQSSPPLPFSQLNSQNTNEFYPAARESSSFPLRVDTQVLVGFLNEDCDLPYIKKPIDDASPAANYWINNYSELSNFIGSTYPVESVSSGDNPLPITDEGASVYYFDSADPNDASAQAEIDEQQIDVSSADTTNASNRTEDAATAARASQANASFEDIVNELDVLADVTDGNNLLDGQRVELAYDLISAQQQLLADTADLIDYQSDEWSAAHDKYDLNLLMKFYRYQLSGISPITSLTSFAKQDRRGNDIAYGQYALTMPDTSTRAGFQGGVYMGDAAGYEHVTLAARSAASAISMGNSIWPGYSMSNLTPLVAAAGESATSVQATVGNTQKTVYQLQVDANTTRNVVLLPDFTLAEVINEEAYLEIEYPGVRSVLDQTNNTVPALVRDANGNIAAATHGIYMLPVQTVVVNNVTISVVWDASQNLFFEVVGATTTQTSHAATDLQTLASTLINRTGGTTPFTIRRTQANGTQLDYFVFDVANPAYWDLGSNLLVSVVRNLGYYLTTPRVIHNLPENATAIAQNYMLEQTAGPYYQNFHGGAQFITLAKPVYDQIVARYREEENGATGILNNRVVSLSSDVIAQHLFAFPSFSANNQNIAPYTAASPSEPFELSGEYITHREVGHKQYYRDDTRHFRYMHPDSKEVHFGSRYNAYLHPDLVKPLNYANANFGDSVLKTSVRNMLIVYAADSEETRAFEHRWFNNDGTMTSEGFMSLLSCIAIPGGIIAGAIGMKARSHNYALTLSMELMERLGLAEELHEGEPLDDATLEAERLQELSVRYTLNPVTLEDDASTSFTRPEESLTDDNARHMLLANTEVDHHILAGVTDSYITYTANKGKTNQQQQSLPKNVAAIMLASLSRAATQVAGFEIGANARLLTESLTELRTFFANNTDINLLLSDEQGNVVLDLEDSISTQGTSALRPVAGGGSVVIIPERANYIRIRTNQDGSYTTYNTNDEASVAESEVGKSLPIYNYHTRRIDLATITQIDQEADIVQVYWNEERRVYVQLTPINKNVSPTSDVENSIQSNFAPSTNTTITASGDPITESNVYIEDPADITFAGPARTTNNQIVYAYVHGTTFTYCFWDATLNAYAVLNYDSETYTYSNAEVQNNGQTTGEQVYLVLVNGTVSFARRDANDNTFRQLQVDETVEPVVYTVDATNVDPVTNDSLYGSGDLLTLTSDLTSLLDNVVYYGAAFASLLNGLSLTTDTAAQTTLNELLADVNQAGSSLSDVEDALRDLSEDQVARFGLLDRTQWELHRAGGALSGVLSADIHTTALQYACLRMLSYTVNLDLQLSEDGRVVMGYPYGPIVGVALDNISSARTENSDMTFIVRVFGSLLQNDGKEPAAWLIHTLDCETFPFITEITEATDTATVIAYLANNNFFIQLAAIRSLASYAEIRTEVEEMVTTLDGIIEPVLSRIDATRLQRVIGGVRAEVSVPTYTQHTEYCGQNKYLVYDGVYSCVWDTNFTYRQHGTIVGDNFVGVELGGIDQDTANSSALFPVGGDGVGLRWDNEQNLTLETNSLTISQVQNISIRTDSHAQLFGGMWITYMPNKSDEIMFNTSSAATANHSTVIGTSLCADLMSDRSLICFANSNTTHLTKAAFGNRDHICLAVALTRTGGEFKTHALRTEASGTSFVQTLAICEERAMAEKEQFFQHSQADGVQMDTNGITTYAQPAAPTINPVAIVAAGGASNVASMVSAAACATKLSRAAGTAIVGKTAGDLETINKGTDATKATDAAKLGDIDSGLLNRLNKSGYVEQVRQADDYSLATQGKVFAEVGLGQSKVGQAARALEIRKGRITQDAAEQSVLATRFDVTPGKISAEGRVTADGKTIVSPLEQVDIQRQAARKADELGKGKQVLENDGFLPGIKIVESTKRSDVATAVDLSAKADAPNIQHIFEAAIRNVPVDEVVASGKYGQDTKLTKQIDSEVNDFISGYRSTIAETQNAISMKKIGTVKDYYATVRMHANRSINVGMFTMLKNRGFDGADLMVSIAKRNDKLLDAAIQTKNADELVITSRLNKKVAMAGATPRLKKQVTSNKKLLNGPEYVDAKVLKADDSKGANVVMRDSQLEVMENASDLKILTAEAAKANADIKFIDVQLDDLKNATKDAAAELSSQLNKADAAGRTEKAAQARLTLDSLDARKAELQQSKDALIKQRENFVSELNRTDDGVVNTKIEELERSLNRAANSRIYVEDGKALVLEDVSVKLDSMVADVRQLQNQGKTDWGSDMQKALYNMVELHKKNTKQKATASFRDALRKTGGVDEARRIDNMEKVHAGLVKTINSDVPALLKKQLQAEMNYLMKLERSNVTFRGRLTDEISDLRTQLSALQNKTTPRIDVNRMHNADGFEDFGDHVDTVMHQARQKVDTVLAEIDDVAIRELAMNSFKKLKEQRVGFDNQMSVWSKSYHGNNHDIIAQEAQVLDKAYGKTDSFDPNLVRETIDTNVDTLGGKLFEVYEQYIVSQVYNPNASKVEGAQLGSGAAIGDVGRQGDSANVGAGPHSMARSDSVATASVDSLGDVAPMTKAELDARIKKIYDEALEGNPDVYSGVSKVLDESDMFYGVDVLLDKSTPAYKSQSQQGLENAFYKDASGSGGSSVGKSVAGGDVSDSAFVGKGADASGVSDSGSVGKGADASDVSDSGSVGKSADGNDVGDGVDEVDGLPSAKRQDKVDAEAPQREKVYDDLAEFHGTKPPHSVLEDSANRVTNNFRELAEQSKLAPDKSADDLADAIRDAENSLRDMYKADQKPHELRDLLAKSDPSVQPEYADLGNTFNQVMHNHTQVLDNARELLKAKRTMEAQGVPFDEAKRLINEAEGIDLDVLSQKVVDQASNDAPAQMDRLYEQMEAFDLRKSYDPSANDITKTDGIHSFDQLQAKMARNQVQSPSPSSSSSKPDTPRSKKETKGRPARNQFVDGVGDDDLRKVIFAGATQLDTVSDGLVGSAHAMNKYITDTFDTFDSLHFSIPTDKVSELGGLMDSMRKRQKALMREVQELQAQWKGLKNEVGILTNRAKSLDTFSVPNVKKDISQWRQQIESVREQLMLKNTEMKSHLDQLFSNQYELTYIAPAPVRSKIAQDPSAKQSVTAKGSKQDAVTDSSVSVKKKRVDDTHEKVSSIPIANTAEILVFQYQAMNKMARFVFSKAATNLAGLTGVQKAARKSLVEAAKKVVKGQALDAGTFGAGLASKSGKPTKAELVDFLTGSSVGTNPRKAGVRAKPGSKPNQGNLASEILEEGGTPIVSKLEMDSLLRRSDTTGKFGFLFNQNPDTLELYNKLASQVDKTSAGSVVSLHTRMEASFLGYMGGVNSASAKLSRFEWLQEPFEQIRHNVGLTSGQKKIVLPFEEAYLKGVQKDIIAAEADQAAAVRRGSASGSASTTSTTKTLNGQPFYDGLDGVDEALLDRVYGGYVAKARISPGTANMMMRDGSYFQVNVKSKSHTNAVIAGNNTTKTTQSSQIGKAKGATNKLPSSTDQKHAMPVGMGASMRLHLRDNAIAQLSVDSVYSQAATRQLYGLLETKAKDFELEVTNLKNTSFQNSSMKDHAIVAGRKRVDDVLSGRHALTQQLKGDIDHMAFRGKIKTATYARLKDVLDQSADNPQLLLNSTNSLQVAVVTRAKSNSGTKHTVPEVQRAYGGIAASLKTDTKHLIGVSEFKNGVNRDAILSTLDEAEEGTSGFVRFRYGKHNASILDQNMLHHAFSNNTAALAKLRRKKDINDQMLELESGGRPTTSYGRPKTALKRAKTALKRAEHASRLVDLTPISKAPGLSASRGIRKQTDIYYGGGPSAGDHIIIASVWSHLTQKGKHATSPQQLLEGSMRLDIPANASKSYKQLQIGEANTLPESKEAIVSNLRKDMDGMLKELQQQREPDFDTTRVVYQTSDMMDSTGKKLPDVRRRELDTWRAISEQNAAPINQKPFSDLNQYTQYVDLAAKRHNRAAELLHYSGYRVVGQADVGFEDVLRYGFKRLKTKNLNQVDIADFIRQMESFRDAMPQQFAAKAVGDAMENANGIRFAPVRSGSVMDGSDVAGRRADDGAGFGAGAGELPDGNVSPVSAQPAKMDGNDGTALSNKLKNDPLDSSGLEEVARRGAYGDLPDAQKPMVTKVQDADGAVSDVPGTKGEGVEYDVPVHRSIDGDDASLQLTVSPEKNGDLDAVNDGSVSARYGQGGSDGSLSVMSDVPGGRVRHSFDQQSFDEVDGRQLDSAMGADGTPQLRDTLITVDDVDGNVYDIGFRRHPDSDEIEVSWRKRDADGDEVDGADLTGVDDMPPENMVMIPAGDMGNYVFDYNSIRLKSNAPDHLLRQAMASDADAIRSILKVADRAATFARYIKARHLAKVGAPLPGSALPVFTALNQFDVDRFEREFLVARRRLEIVEPEEIRSNTQVTGTAPDGIDPATSSNPGDTLESGNIAAQTATTNASNSNAGLEQEIIFNMPTTANVNDTMTLTAQASSGLPVTFSSSDTAIGSINANRLTILTAGELTITAEQSGNDTWAPAETVSQTVTIEGADAGDNTSAATSDGSSTGDDSTGTDSNTGSGNADSAGTSDGSSTGDDSTGTDSNTGSGNADGTGTSDGSSTGDDSTGTDSNTGSGNADSAGTSDGSSTGSGNADGTSGETSGSEEVAEEQVAEASNNAADDGGGGGGGGAAIGIAAAGGAASLRSSLSEVVGDQLDLAAADDDEKNKEGEWHNDTVAEESATTDEQFASNTEATDQRADWHNDTADSQFESDQANNVAQLDTGADVNANADASIQNALSDGHDLTQGADEMEYISQASTLGAEKQDFTLGKMANNAARMAGSKAINKGVKAAKGAMQQAQQTKATNAKQADAAQKTQQAARPISTAENVTPQANQTTDVPNNPSTHGEMNAQTETNAHTASTGGNGANASNTTNGDANNGSAQTTESQPSKDVVAEAQKTSKSGFSSAHQHNNMSYDSPEEDDWFDTSDNQKSHKPKSLNDGLHTKSGD